MTPADEEAEFQRCSAINSEWNLKIAEIRDARVAKENEERREYIQERLELKEAREAQEMTLIEDRIRVEKESSKHFITRENIDQHIDQALANPVDYNFAIDLKGNKLKNDNEMEQIQ